MRRSFEPEQAEFACVACRRLKRKCTRDIPTCTLCAKVGRPCDYQDPGKAAETPESSHSAISSSSSVTRATPGKRPVSRTSIPLAAHLPSPLSLASYTSTSTSPARWYLDSVATRGSALGRSEPLNWRAIINTLPAPTMPEAQSIFNRHFSTSHDWLPVVSRKRLGRQLQECHEVVEADLVALLYAMDLLSNTAVEVHHLQYQAVKAALLACEQVNHITTNLLAAEILVAALEIAQGFFPTAYLSIGHCSRLFYALGLHDRKKPTQLIGTVSTWTESEERRRLWWAIIILDRYVHAGFRFRPLLVPSIPPDEILPATDDEWDKGELTVNALLVMSIEAQTSVSSFARTCQAAHILGKVCEHVNDHPVAVDVDMHLQEALQIIRAIKSLKTMVDDEISSSERPHRLLSAKALCMSALILMYDVHGCIEEVHLETSGINRGMRLELQQMSIDGCKVMAEEAAAFAEELSAFVDSHGNATVSPMVMNCLYGAAGTSAWLHRETGSEKSLKMLEVSRKALQALGEKWAVAGEYLGLLEGTEFTYQGGCYQ